MQKRVARKAEPAHRLLSTMSVGTAIRRAPLEWLVSHLRVPLYREGYALVLSSGVTSVVGVLYWVLAARTYSPHVVGVNSAAIYAMMFLAGVAQLNLASALRRFVPVTGRGTGRFVLLAYLMGMSFAALLGLVFVLGVDRWSPNLSFLASSPQWVVGFTLATMAWCLFSLEDGVLAGLRNAVWVPIENTLYSFAKIALLLAFIGFFPAYGVFASWTLGLLVAVVPVNVLIFTRLIPGHADAAADRPNLPTRRQIASYIGADYIGSIFALASGILVPVVVLELAGATANAYFALPWVIAWSVYLISANMGYSLVVSGASDEARLETYIRQAFVQTARLVLPATLMLVVAAPVVLRLFGRNYAEEGTILLQLLALAAVPNMVTALYLSVCRVQRRMSAVVLVLASQCVLFLASTVVLLNRYGIVGVGVAWLATQSIIALGIVLDSVRTSSRVPGGFRLGQFAWELDAVGALLRLGGRARDTISDWRRAADVAEIADAVLARIPVEPDGAAPSSWTDRRLVRTVSDMTVLMLAAPGEQPRAVLKLPRTEHAVAGLVRGSEVLSALQEDSRLRGWSGVLPKVLGQGEVVGCPYLVEKAVQGLPADRLLASADSAPTVLLAATTAISELHRRTAIELVLDENMIQHTFVRLVEETRGAYPRFSEGEHEAKLNRIMRDVRESLLGRAVALSWIHGDFGPGNVFVTEDGTTVTGIVDWELASSKGLPLVDVVQLLVSTRMLLLRRELGRVVGDLLADGWTRDERELLAAAQSQIPGEPLELRAVLLLSWLRHVHGNLLKSTRYGRNPLWLRRNIDSVLKSAAPS